MNGDFLQARMDMVSDQIARRGVKDKRVLDALRQVPRHAFVPPDVQLNAYDDFPLPIGMGQTISQPYIVGLMTELLTLTGPEKVLEIGTGSGYQAAILSLLCAQVITLERHPPLAEAARTRLKALGYSNVVVICRDGSGGVPEQSPFDGIIVTAASPRIPQPLLDQLDEGGRMVIPTGSQGSQTLQRAVKFAGSVQVTDILSVVFVPLRGEYGWNAEEPAK